jgi:uncharacterized alpha-E superfamily protein
MARLLSRYAECTFWLARYMERVENTARILDVTETFARDQAKRNWTAVVQINADEARFFSTHPVAEARAVQHFYLLDWDNPTSVPFAVKAARENARTIRSNISIAQWRHLNRFYNRLREMGEGDTGIPSASRLCEEFINACHIHTGITEATFFRDEAWSFYAMGRALERADQTTRLLDIKYHLLLPSLSEVGSAVDLSQWNAVLRAATGYQAFRRVYSGRMTPASVAGFLLFSDSFPRSVSHCLHQLNWHLGQMRIRYGLRGGSPALECLDELRAALMERTIEEVIAKGLHEFIDWCQIRLGFVGGEIARAFFGYEGVVKEQAWEQTQA